ncbi:MAG: GatB/YqeY domain-containing protein [Alphaproteobacteria bacterium]
MLREQLSESLKTAMKAREALTLSTLRLILAAIKDRDIEARGAGNDEGIDDTQITALLQTMVKQRREAIKIALEGKRQDIAQKEEKEIEIIQRFLPEPMTDSEIDLAIKNIVEETGASSIKEMGAVMAKLKEQYLGRMDFGQVSKKVRDALS